MNWQKEEKGKNQGQRRGLKIKEERDNIINTKIHNLADNVLLSTSKYELAKARGGIIGEIPCPPTAIFMEMIPRKFF